MDRRDFLQGVTLAGAAAAVPGGVLAGDDGSGAVTTLVLVQAGRGAEDLGAAIAAALDRAGVAGVRSVRIDGGDLSAVPQLAAQACGQPGCRIVGVMDDAVATIFLSVAGTCGAGYHLEASHRIDTAAVRHAVRPAGLEDGLAWSEQEGGWERRIADFYAAIVAGRAPRIDAQRIVAARPASDGVSLVSFVINT